MNRAGVLPVDGEAAEGPKDMAQAVARGGRWQRGQK